MSKGAVGYLTKGVREARIRRSGSCRGVRRGGVLAGVRRLAGGGAGSSVDDDRFGAGLTARETEIVAHVAEGRSNKEIARIVGIVVKTVETHLQRIFTKPGAANRREVMNWARDRGMSEPPDVTARQSRVLSLIARGLRNVEIATRLGTTTAEIESEVRSILEAMRGRHR